VRYLKYNKSVWADILLSPFVIALPIAMAIIFLLPEMFSKYRLESIESRRSHKANSVEEYYDLDGNGYSERVVAFHNEIKKPALIVLSNNGVLKGQWNFRGKYPKRKGFLYCGDMNNDSIKEIYLFTISADTIYLNAIAPFTDNVMLFKDKFIATINKRNDTIQAYIDHGIFYDLDRDGTRELIFAVKAEFSLQPRAVYSYNLANDSINHSLIYGANMGQMIVTDHDDYEGACVYGAYSTLGNIHDSINIPYSDYSSYFMGFDHSLELLFPPIKYNVYPSGTSIAELNVDGEQVIAVHFKNYSDNNIPSELKLINLRGETIRELKIQADDPILGSQLRIAKVLDEDNNELLVMLGGDKVVLLENGLAIKEIIEIEDVNLFLRRYDLNQDGTEEMLFADRDQNILITQAGFNHTAKLETNRDPFSSIPFCLSIKTNGLELPEIFIKGDNNKGYLYSFSSNVLYYLKYPIWIAIYIAVLFLILLIRFIQKIQLRRKMEIENRMNVLQLKTIKSQMDPHFMFNALNSISTNILKKQHDIAYRYLVKYSNMLRMLFTNADQLTISLEEEIAFVKQYLELEKFRFKEKLNFDINVDSHTNTKIHLPRMLIQLFVENAIKHGIRHLDGLGKIEIFAEQKKDHILIRIQDNGIGRQAAKKYSEGHGVGLKLIDEMITLFKKTNGKQISYSYQDLKHKNSGSASTIVSLIIPLN